MELDYFNNAIETRWEEYDKHLVETGQLMTWNDYVMFVDHGLDETYYSELELDYESATHGS
jgi:hypothetical protein